MIGREVEIIVGQDAWVHESEFNNSETFQGTWLALGLFNNSETFQGHDLQVRDIDTHELNTWLVS